MKFGSAKKPESPPRCYMCPNATEADRLALVAKGLHGQRPLLNCKLLSLVARIEIGAYDPEISPDFLARSLPPVYHCGREPLGLSNDEEVTRVVLPEHEDQVRQIYTVRGNDLARVVMREMLEQTSLYTGPQDLETITAQHWSPEG